MEGTLESKDGQVIIAGTFKGNVIAKSLIIEPSSIFTGTINAEHVKIEGKVDADITADHLEVSNTGVLMVNLKLILYLLILELKYQEMSPELLDEFFFLLGLYTILKKFNCFFRPSIFSNS